MAAKTKGGGSKVPSDGTHHRSKAPKPVKKAFERTKKSPRPTPAAEAPYGPEPMAEESGDGVLPPFIDDDG